MPQGVAITNRAKPHTVALETTLLCHGVPREAALPLADALEAIVRSHGAEPALVGVINGRPTVGLTRDELQQLLKADRVAKVNAANLGLAIHRGQNAATTVATTMELAAAAGVRVFATGGIGGVHRNYATHLDISSDLAALTRFPVAIVTSGVKSLLDVIATREALETLGIPVVGYRTDRFPAFYLRDGGCDVDARMDDVEELGKFAASELARTHRAVVIANPIPEQAELEADEWRHWLDVAEQRAQQEQIAGREVTPRTLAHLHTLSGGRTLEANLALVKSNAALAARLAARIDA